MEGNQNVVAKGNIKAIKKNFRWTARKHQFLASYLAKRARKGEKKGKSFGRLILDQAALAVSDVFEEECTKDNIESWLKTAKKKYTRIMTLREKSGWTWDDTNKVIVVDKTIAMEFIEANSYARDLLNTPLDDFEDLRLVCGEDLATGSHAKSNSDIKFETVVHDEATSESQDVAQPTSSEAPKESRGKRTRQSYMEETLAVVGGLSKQVALLTEAVGSDQEFVSRVFDEVMNMDGFSEQVLNKAFEHLTERPLAGRQFIARRPHMRVEWLKDFASNIN
ncbi:hypothetical protein ACHQM5_023293 [Ranunculus cassubicifolius]